MNNFIKSVFGPPLMFGSRVLRPAASVPESDRPLPLLGELATLSIMEIGVCQYTMQQRTAFEGCAT